MLYNLTMARLLQIAQLGHPVLREKTFAIKKLNNKVRELSADMLYTLKDVNGVGLAAPQVYESQKIFIIASHPNKRYPKAPLVAPQAIINPQILSASNKLVKDWEGCLSIPGLRGLVPRHYSVTARYLTLDGKETLIPFQTFWHGFFSTSLTICRG